MEITTIPDLKFEKTFMAIRASILKHLGSLNGYPAVNKFLSHLAMHYFTNEFIPLEKEWEKLELNKLEQKITDLLAKGLQPSIEEVLSFAAYRYYINLIGVGILFSLKIFAC